MNRPARLLAPVLLASLTGLVAGAQSFNIDLGTSGTAPSASFPGAANQPGVWNNITSATPTTTQLIRGDGSSSSVTFTRTPGGTFATNANAALTGEYSNLLSDTQAASSLSYTFSGLTNGYYLVYVYALDANATDTYSVNSSYSNGVGTQTTGGAIPTSNSYAAGKTHAINCVYLSFGTFTITISSSTMAQCAGIQLVRLADPNEVHFFVKPSAVGNNSGTSWDNAFTSLQEAIDTIHRIGPGFALWVTAGTYKPTTGSDRTASFRLHSGNHYYGGFKGTEATLADRVMPPYLNQTILSGAIGSSADTDNSYTVVDATNASEYTDLDGFTIARGYNNAPGSGGGLLLEGSSARITNCRFLYNTASAMGGAVYCHNGSPRFRSCYFLENQSLGSGGALYYAGFGADVELTNCQFLGNQASTHGGALGVSNGVISALNCLFSGNTAGIGASGGAAYLAGNASSLQVSSFTNCSFTANSSNNGGGAVYATSLVRVDFFNSILWNDHSTLNHASDEFGSTIGSSATFANTTRSGVAGTDGLDPSFVDADGKDNLAGTSDDNLRLAPGSPCVDSGRASWLPKDSGDFDDDNYVSEPFPLDLDLKPRQSDVVGVADGPNAGVPALDRGCYELQMPACPADLNSDDVVDLLDFFEFFNAWDTTTTDADVDLSGEVDLGDFFLFFQYFDSGC